MSYLKPLSEKTIERLYREAGIISNFEVNGSANQIRRDNQP